MHQAQLKLADTLKKLGEHADKNGPKFKILKLKIFRGFELDQNWKVSLPYQIFLGLELDLDIAGDMAALKVTRRSYLDLDVQKIIEILWLYSFLTHYLQLLGKLQTHRKLLTCKSTEKHLTYKSTEKFSPANLQKHIWSVIHRKTWPNSNAASMVLDSMTLILRS